VTLTGAAQAELTNDTSFAILATTTLPMVLGVITNMIYCTISHFGLVLVHSNLCYKLLFSMAHYTNVEILEK
jgi:hypothetical protein